MIEPKQEIQGIQWEDFRGGLGEIHLIHVYEWVYSEKASDNVKRYLRSVQAVRAVQSRQIAAMAIINARAFEIMLNMPPNLGQS